MTDQVINCRAAALDQPAFSFFFIDRVKSEPIIEIEYENKSVERIVTSNLSITQILDLVQNKAQEMDTATKLKAAGIDGQKLDSTWGQFDKDPQKTVGTTAFIPRQQ